MRRRGAVCLLGALILAACNGSPKYASAQAMRLVVSPLPGATYQYLVHIRASLTSTGPGVATTTDLTMRQTYRVTSVDPSGVATVKIAVDQLSGTMDHQLLQIPVSLPDFSVQVARDGTVRYPGTEQLASLASGLALAAPGPFAAVVPALPGDVVRAGSRWSRQTSLPRFAGGASAEITWANDLLRFDSLNGTRLAVIAGQFTAPMDIRLTFFKPMVSDLTPIRPPDLVTPPPGRGSPLPAPSPLFPDGLNPIIHLQGTTAGRMTSWVDPASGQLVKATGTSTSSVKQTITGVPSPAAIAFPFDTGPSQMTETQAIEILGGHDLQAPEILPSPVSAPQAQPAGVPGLYTYTASSGRIKLAVPYRFWLYTHCGISSSAPDFDGSFWTPIGGTGTGMPNPPAGLANPEDDGTMTLLSADLAEYRSSSGPSIRFSRLGPTRLSGKCL